MNVNRIVNGTGNVWNGNVSCYTGGNCNVSIVFFGPCYNAIQKNKNHATFVTEFLDVLKEKSSKCLKKLYDGCQSGVLQ